ncbi:MAG TPA: TIGR03790 family protein, partial [Verrucomicrobiae bacterium]|nr:TIGR03790 family protein [Verrucomicrobiae bacterium]
MRNCVVQFVVLIFALAPALARAGGGEVVVIYNSRVPESKAVAEYYAQKRQVPQSQVFGFALTTNEVISRAEFVDALQTPLARRLESDGLWRFGSFTNAPGNGQPRRVIRGVVKSKIRYAVLCYGVPLKIAPDADWPAVVNSNQPAQFQQNEAAVDSELAWLPLIEMKPSPSINGPMPNWTYGVTNAAALDPTNGILLVSRLDGPSADIARGLVDKALQAERDGLWGRAYFDARGLTTNQPDYLLGDKWILGAAQVARALGFETVVDDKPEVFPADFPMSQIAIYAGWYSGNACGPFQLPKVEFMPGAFAYHLHSFSAATLRSASQDWCGPLLAKGATCTMGCVYEPYLALTP